jgi:hypothetical protein
VTAPDFEINARIRAKRLVPHVPPEARTEGEEVTLARDEERTGVPARIASGEHYSDVVIDKRIVGEMRGGDATAAHKSGRLRQRSAKAQQDGVARSGTGEVSTSQRRLARRGRC